VGKVEYGGETVGRAQLRLDRVERMTMMIPDFARLSVVVAQFHPTERVLALLDDCLEPWLEELKWESRIVVGKSVENVEEEMATRDDSP
jgi:hypothetical protein